MVSQSQNVKPMRRSRKKHAMLSSSHFLSISLPLLVQAQTSIINRTLAHSEEHMESEPLQRLYDKRPTFICFCHKMNGKLLPKFHLFWLVSYFVQRTGYVWKWWNHNNAMFILIEISIIKVSVLRPISFLKWKEDTK